MVGVAEDNQGDGAGVAGVVEINAEEPAPGASRCQRRLRAGAIVCVARDSEDEGPKVRPRLELSVLWSLEWGRAGSFRGRGGVERGGTIHRGVVDRDPAYRV